MRIMGIGTDIVQISRIQQVAERRETFAKRVLHANELVIFKSHSQQYHYLAKRFAAKEALAKAIGTGIRGGIHLAEIETRNDKLGKPYFHFHGTTREHMERLSFGESFLTLSDEREYAVAYVILTGTGI